MSAIFASIKKLQNRWITKTLAAWAISFGGASVGIWLSLGGDEIGASTGAFLSALPAPWRAWPPAPLTIVFWVLLLAWAWLLFQRLRADDRAIDERQLTLIRAIRRSPDARVLTNYPNWYFQPVLNALGPLVVEQSGTASEVAERIRDCLKIIAEMGRDFARADPKEANYGANVMLVADDAQFDRLAERVRFVQSKREVKGLRAVLYLPEALLLSHLPGGKTRSISLIALPVSEVEATPEGYRLAIPGAPTALLNGTPSIFMDTRTLHEECGHLAEAVREKIREYFSLNGDGRDIRSFASFRMGSADNPVGVLNIDSNQPEVLGPEPEYYATFAALLAPLLAALTPHVQLYAELAREELLPPAKSNSAEALEGIPAYERPTPQPDRGT